MIYRRAAGPRISHLPRAILFTVLASAIAFPGAVSQSVQNRGSYLNPDLPIAQRVDDLVGRMTLEEKIAQMQNDAPAIPRLHVPAYNWWNEALHGVARSGYATVFPQAIGLAATWDTGLIHRVGDTISTEARAKYNQAQRERNTAIYYGLTMWSPNINIDRDPRWGRGQETYGEDPFLTGQIGSAFVRGLQGDDPDHPKTIATPKHFAVHSGPESERHTFDAVISPHDLEDTYLPAFRTLIADAHAGSIMCAYNAVDGVPACSSDLLLQQKLTHDWGFRGYVVSDCAAITDIAAGHKFAPDMAHAAASSLKAGTDLSCGREYGALLDALHQGLISNAAIDTAVKRLFTARIRLGMFDPPDRVTYNRIPFTENDSTAHAALSLQAARESIVLLKNDRRALPLSPSIRTIAVVGPNAAALPALEGNYNAIASHPITPLAALEQRLPGHVRYSQGSPYVQGVPIVVPQSALSTVDRGKHIAGLHAEYFDGTDLSGDPKFTRFDPNIDFDWNGASPARGISPGAFAVRWTGSFTPPAAGPITFSFSLAHCSTCDDAETVRVWIDDKLISNFEHQPTPGRRAPTTPFTVNFADTAAHALRIEYTHRAPHFGAGLTFSWQPPAAALRAEAVAAARQSEVVIAFLGLSPEIEGEEMPLHVKGFNGGDRTAIELPEAQMQLVDGLAATGKPLILVLMNGSALALGSAHDKASAVLEAWYPGEAGGAAITDTLFGRSNPSGRLPITFYASTAQLPSFDNYSMKERTYRYFTGEPLYRFGFGLSYTRFAYSGGKLSAATLQAGQPLHASINIKNVGARAGSETVEFYLIPKSRPGGPLRALVAFAKQSLASGQTATVHATIDARALSMVDADGRRSVEPGDYELFIGGGQPGSSDGQSLPFRIRGSTAIAP
ncbi:MAG TPA: glycoside hydrolase family 3 C-terminal domain-containing protein [Acidobacteriaceae bacterium]|nr:glycoside hydrolase family 3 C-terminal domain-containing protein [Acidobacteriaceae bacterium]